MNKLAYAKGMQDALLSAGLVKEAEELEKLAAPGDRGDTLTPIAGGFGALPAALTSGLTARESPFGSGAAAGVGSMLGGIGGTAGGSALGAGLGALGGEAATRFKQWQHDREPWYKRLFMGRPSDHEYTGAGAGLGAGIGSIIGNIGGGAYGAHVGRQSVERPAIRNEG